MVDDQDEWDEKIKQELRYSVRILIKHPDIDPSKVTDALGLEPNMTKTAGAPRTTPKGGPLPGVNPVSMWSLWFRVERNRFFFQDVIKLIDRLEPHKEFLHRIVDEGGSILLDVHLPGEINIGNALPWRDMARLAALHINLGRGVSGFQLSEPWRPGSVSNLRYRPMATCVAGRTWAAWPA